MRLAIVGNPGGTNVGESLLRAATQQSIPTQFLDATAAYRAWRPLQAFCWRFLDRRPARMRPFSNDVVKQCRDFRPDVLIATGQVPISADDLKELNGQKIVTVNYSTDDPWSPNHRAKWFLRALPEYRLVFTPRTANVADLQRIGCHHVEYLPFGYDPTMWYPDTATNQIPADILFVGGGDDDRGPILTALAEAGLKLAIYGSYWDRYPALRPFIRGQVGPDEIRRVSSVAALALILVRRANRDEHVMRSFEAAAMKSCLLVEDTPEHRAIFGHDGENVCYFQSTNNLILRAKELLANPSERNRLAAASYDIMVAGQHTYTDRFGRMMAVAANVRALQYGHNDE